MVGEETPPGRPKSSPVTGMSEEFIGEQIAPVSGTMTAEGMARGEPGLPLRFIWREQEHEIAAVLGTWSDTREGVDGPDMRYRYRHWFRVRTTSGLVMRIYFIRNPASRTEARHRWWLYSIERR